MTDGDPTLGTPARGPIPPRTRADSAAPRDPSASRGGLRRAKLFDGDISDDDWLSLRGRVERILHIADLGGITIEDSYPALRRFDSHCLLRFPSLRDLETFAYVTDRPEDPYYFRRRRNYGDLANGWDWRVIPRESGGLSGEVRIPLGDLGNVLHRLRCWAERPDA